VANIRIGQWLQDFMRFTDLHDGHRTVDSDCLLAKLISEATTGSEVGQPVAEALSRLAVDPVALGQQLDVSRPAGGFGGGAHVTARIELVMQRSRDEAARPAGNEDLASAVAIEPIHLRHAVLFENDGPAAQAFRAVGVEPTEARRTLGIPEPGAAHILPALWPPPRYPREFAYPDEIQKARRGGTRTPMPPRVDPPEPTEDAEPGGFVWTGVGSTQLEMWAEAGGPIHLRLRNGQAVEIEISAESAELIGRMLDGYYHQLQAERWEPIHDAERRRLPKPRPDD
jgi:hypothetical protein